MDQACAQFGPFEFDRGTGELRRRGRVVPLPPQPSRVLDLLVSRPGNVVTRDEIRRHLWGDATFVDYEAGVNYCLNRIRSALHDKGRAPRYVETLPRRGYRFIAPVAGDRAFPEPTLAVLPFENLNHDPALDYFADGVTDALITELGSIAALHVISRQSVVHLKGSQRSLPDIARDLSADALVEGSVLRAGRRVRITAQLVNPQPERHVWAEAYESDVGDILSTQRQAARAIAEHVHAALTPGDLRRLGRVQLVNPEAHEAYLKACHYGDQWTKEGFLKAIEQLREAIRGDPAYAPPYAALAHSLSLLGYWGHVPPCEVSAPAKEAATKALDLDESLVAAHHAMGWIKWIFDWDRAGCEKEIARALELGPSSASAHALNAGFLSTFPWRKDEALAEARLLTRLDPLSLYGNSVAAWVYLFTREYELAAAQARKTLELHPASLQACYVLGWALLYRGRPAEAVTAFEKAAEIQRDPISLGYLGHAYGRTGRVGEVQRILDEMQELSRSQYVPPKCLISLYSGLGDNDRTFEWLEKAYANRDPMLLWLHVAPPIDAMRSDPRFPSLVRRMGLAAGSRRRRSGQGRRRTT